MSDLRPAYRFPRPLIGVTDRPWHARREGDAVPVGDQDRITRLPAEPEQHEHGENAP
ncbi:hypothetical protein [Streptomyces luteireticuli]|uniref:hypothetical protein n=1 Tax=Streptomyces luteireticuli TaxID=173858 RepID=UPI0035573CDF